MAKYQIERACGHTETVNICGPHKDRDRKAEYESGKLCHECYQAKVQTERDAAAEQAAEQAAATGLPELAGSDKQIKWALQIRAEVIAELDGYRAALDSAPDQAQRELAESIMDWIAGQTSASWWIDNRGKSARMMIRDRHAEVA